MEGSKHLELRIVRKLLDEMNKEILYCHWKSNQHFDMALAGVDDLDILIDRDQYEVLTTLLFKLGFKRFYIPQARAYVGIEDFLGFDEETGRIVHLHLHCRLVVGEKHLKGFQLPLEKRMLERRVWDEKFQAYLSEPFDELLLLIIRTGMKARRRDIAKKRMMTGSTLAEFEWLKEKCPNFEKQLAGETWLSSRIKGLCAECFTQDMTWRRAYRLHRWLYQDLACWSQGGMAHNTLKRNEHEFVRIILEIRKRMGMTDKCLLRRRCATGGVTISFIGSDGSGKSSAIKEMTVWLKSVMDVRYFYLGSGDGNSSLLRRPMKAVRKLAIRVGLLKKTQKAEKSAENIISYDEKKIGKLQHAWIYALSRERIKKLKSANRCRMSGFVVLTDRYPQNEYTGLCDGPRLKGKGGIAAKEEAKAFRIAELCPPDLVIKLLVSPEVAAQRKPGEIQTDISKALTERVKALRFSEQTKIVELNGDQEQAQVWREIKQAIWNAI